MSPVRSVFLGIVTCVIALVDVAAVPTADAATKAVTMAPAVTLRDQPITKYSPKPRLLTLRNELTRWMTFALRFSEKTAD